MTDLNWRRYQEEFALLADVLVTDEQPSPVDLVSRIRLICQNDPAVDHLILGVDPSLLAFLEYLFFRAEGPYAPCFRTYAKVIIFVCQSSPELCNLLNLNSADAIGNMILNKRGKLKFVIADHLELLMLLDWWPLFGLAPVNQRQVFDAIIQKSSIHRRLSSSDPVLIMRLLEVFPLYQSEFCPDEITLEELLNRRKSVSPLPSHKRYHRLLEELTNQGLDIFAIIRQEEQRILPIQVSRNTFLSYLVKQLHQNTCQICNLHGPSLPDSEITVHHIVPLSAGGADSARNMLVVCRIHHRAIHAGEINVSINEIIEISYQGTIYCIVPNT